MERSIPFHWLNAGKESVTLDLKTGRGRNIVTALVERADVVVENFRPKVMASLGLDYETLRAVNPQIIFTSISNFGPAGPYRDYQAEEIVLYAMSGGMIATGDRDRPPLAAGPPIAQYTAGLHAYVATLLALHRETRGERIDVSIHESALENVEIQLAEHLANGKVPRRSGDTHLFVPWQCYPCRDGYAAILSGPMRRWPQAAHIFGDARLASAEFAHMRARHAKREQVEAMIRPWLESHDRIDIYRIGQSVGLAFGHLASLKEALESPQHRARGFFVDSDPHPEVGRLRVCGPIYRIEGVDWRVGRAPLLGEHTRAVLRDAFGHDDDEIDRVATEGVI